VQGLEGVSIEEVGEWRRTLLRCSPTAGDWLGHPMTLLEQGLYLGSGQHLARFARFVSHPGTDKRGLWNRDFRCKARRLALLAR
jgi:hypothetical protein